MLLLYSLVLLLHSVYSLDYCQDRQKIVPQDIQSVSEAVGDWMYVYHFDTGYDMGYFAQFHFSSCSPVNITLAKPELVQQKNIECDLNKRNPTVKWDNAKLRIRMSFINIRQGVIFAGDGNVWRLENDAFCFGYNIKIQKISDDFIILVLPDYEDSIQLLARYPITEKQLKCLVDNLDVTSTAIGYPTTGCESFVQN